RIGSPSGSRNRVTDHDAFRSDQHFPDEQAKDPLTLWNGGTMSCLAQAHQEALKVFRELEIRLPIHRLCFQSIELSPQGWDLLPRFRHAAAKFVQCDELLL